MKFAWVILVLLPNLEMNRCKVWKWPLVEFHWVDGLGTHS